ncbi:MAG: hypothetical protein VX278_19595, partial [Myxococcota bacterium]|nr:hypothetical protein [Myxococcota bacterium]
FGSTKRVGKSFSVFKLHVQKEEFDISLPVRNKKDEPYLGIREALRRRDLTINAMAYDPLTKRLFDPFHGKRDLKEGILRATDPETFVEDPLRVFRVAQFAARLSFTIDDSLKKLCRDISLSHVSAERLSTEFHKMWLKSPKPSIGLKAMRELKLFSRLFPRWKNGSEKEVCDAVDRVVPVLMDKPYKLALFWVAALHKTPSADAEEVLTRLKIFSIENVNVKRIILFALQCHNRLHSRCTDTDLRRLSEEGSLLFLFTVFEILHNQKPQDLIDRAKQLHIYSKSLPILLQGRDLLPLGIKGKEIGTKLAELRRLQVEGLITNREKALSWIKRDLT